MKYNLADICEYAKGKVDVAILDDETYIHGEYDPQQGWHYSIFIADHSTNTDISRRRVLCRISDRTSEDMVC